MRGERVKFKGVKRISMPSLVPRPHLAHEERGLVTIERFLGCAESAVLILNNPMK